jgi:hypothetical protein
LNDIDRDDEVGFVPADYVTVPDWNHETVWEYTSLKHYDEEYLANLRAKLIVLFPPNKPQGGKYLINYLLEYYIGKIESHYYGIYRWIYNILGQNW